MKEGGWLTAKEARDWGFVDEVTDLGETKPVLTDAVASALAEAGLPIPNVPTESKETLFARFLASIASLFKTARVEAEAAPATPEVSNSHNDSNPEKHSDPMNQLLPLLGKVLNLEGFAAGEDGCTMTLDQVKAVEQALADKDKRIAELADELSAVKKSPADTSTAVINESKTDKPEPQNEVQSYVETCNKAKDLYNLVP